MSVPNKDKDHILFHAGPGKISKEVLITASSDIINYNKLDKSICELSHQELDWKNVYSSTLFATRTFLDIPDSHELFYMNGGATLQMSIIS